MGWAVHPGAASRSEAHSVFAAEGCSPARDWANGPGDRYGAHIHDRPKVLFCLEGSLVFHMEDGDAELTAGDRLDLQAGTRHAATVGPEGCSCIEAWGP